jgi:predicted CXXCH cytochrome family protein
MQLTCNSNLARHVRTRSRLAYPAVSVAIAVSTALAVIALGPSQVMAVGATPAPTETIPAAPTTAATNPSPSPQAPVTTTPSPSVPAPSATPSQASDAVVVPTETLAPTGRGGAAYPLVPALSVATAPIDTTSALAAPAPDAATIVPDIHGPYPVTSDKCAICHRSHTAKATNLLTQTKQSILCFTCHDGTGANANVAVQFNDPLVPQNDNVKRLYYRHDTVGAIAHTSAGENEYGGVSNRHTECGDCHNPHQARGTDGAPTGTLAARDGTGSTASGRQTGVSGVSVVNGASGTAPAYTLLDGKTPAKSITREYQLCFKCHSSFTTLTSNTGFVASRYRLDKAVEFNPNNASFHPVEAPGKNISQKMKDSLAGGSLWKFSVDSTIRCVNCHASSTRYPLSSPPVVNQVPPNGDLTMHASKNPGILLQNYRNRILKPRSEGYNRNDFALCYMCHSETPFRSETSTATNFRLHGKHTASIGGDDNVSSTTIDTPGAGGGKAICAECHFRLHSTTSAAGGPVGGSRLVTFAPNVTGTRKWTPGATAGTGTCSLTCHGKTHSGESYSGG